MSDPALRTLAGCVVIFVGVLVVMALFRMLVSAWSRPWPVRVGSHSRHAFRSGRGVLVCMVLVGLGGMTSAPSRPGGSRRCWRHLLETAVLATKLVAGRFGKTNSI
jgi:membrane protein required for colicin V production